MISRRNVLIGTGSVLAAPTVALASVSDPLQKYAFNIEKITVNAQSRALKAEYTLELEQPLQWFCRSGAIEEIQDILTENDPKTTKIRTEDGTVLWQR